MNGKKLKYWKIRYEPDEGLIDAAWADDPATADSLKACREWNVLCDTAEEAIEDFNKWNRTGRRMVGKPEECCVSEEAYENG